MLNPDPLVTMVVGGIVAAFILGFLAHKLRLSPIVGYLFAGVLIGPYTLGVVTDGELAGELAELGVILIMFGVGLKFSPAKLMKYRWVALPGALGQMALVTAIGFSVASLLGLDWVEGLILAFSLSVASTIVLLRSLEDGGRLASPAGRLAVSWLVVQDAAAVLVLVLVLMSTIAVPGGNIGGDTTQIVQVVGIKVAEVVLFILAMVVIGRRIMPWLVVFIARTRSRELFSLGVFAIALGVAYAAHAVFGASFALGAFLAGLVLNETDISHRAAEELLPLRDAFAVPFFVSVGMLFDPQILITQSWTIAAFMAVIIFGNGVVAFLMTSLLRVPLEQRSVLAGGLAQIGEFSFLICGTALALELISDQIHALIAACALLTIALNPLVRLLALLPAWIARHGRSTDAVDAA
ncbi:MAG: cation:proton antiporter [Rhodomicrobiaceae bacterium]